MDRLELKAKRHVTSQARLDLPQINDSRQAIS
jgi:hypothetical protein